MLFPRQYHPPESSPNPASGFTPHAAASLIAAGVESCIAALFLLGQHSLRALRPPDGRVIVEYSRTLPPNGRARSDQQRGHRDDGQPRLADHPQHPFRALARLRTASGRGRGWRRWILFAFAQFRLDRLLVPAECGFQHLAGSLPLHFRFLL